MMVISSLGVVGAIIAILSIPITGSSLGGTNGSSGFGIGIGGIATLRRSRLPPNSQDPDYVHTTSSGGYVGKSGGDGAIVFICKLPAVGMSDALELRAQYFARLEDKLLDDDDLVVGASSDGTTTTMMKKREVAYQQYRVPGDERRGPYFREVSVKVWGAGGGGCDGGRGEVKDSIPEGGYNSEGDKEEFADDDDASRDDYINYSEGSSGGYAEATFLLPVGGILQVTVGGGGMSQGSQPDSLGGRGGYNGGMFGRSDLMSGGGGGGGMSIVSWNGTVLAAAFGGDGGGNTTYCTARGGLGGVLRDRQDIMMMDSTTLGGGGGGGGGYINFDLAIPSSDETSARVCPSEPVVFALSHESAAFTWSAGSHQYETSKEFYVQKYIVSLSTGTFSRSDEAGDGIRCSGAFTVHEHIQRGFDMNRNATTKLNNLEASTSYCLRIEALSSRGLSLGKQIFIFHTKSMPINEWLPVSVLQLPDASNTVFETSANGGDTDDNESTMTAIWCEHSPTRPTGRRGHTMTIVSDEVYVFGGATLKCVCEGSEYDAEEKCSSKNVFSNELWHFDPLTSTFIELGHDSGVNGVNLWPCGREQHSMTALPNGNLVLIGGRTSTNEYFEIGEESEQPLLADVWTMRDPHHIISSLGFSSDVLGAALPIELIPGHVTSHRMPIALRDDYDVDGELFGHEDLCTRDIQVQISLDRICPNDIEYIMLTAPSTTLTSANHDAPQSIVHETKIFVSRAQVRDQKCQHSSSIDLLFSDDAKDWVLSYANIPETGSFRPANSLMDTFDNIPIHGEWRISIAMAQLEYAEENNGARLLQWEITFDAKSCAPGRPRWKRLPNPPPSFAPRRMHTAVAVDNSIFISGGFADRHLNDLWRFDYDSHAWVELSQVSPSVRSPRPMNHGQVSVLGPFGLLSFGGLSKPRPQQQNHDLQLLNIFDGGWKSVHIPRNESSRDENDIPDSRYLSSIGLLNNAHSIYQRYNIKDGSGAMILVFGGDGKLLHNAYADSYGYISNSLFDDVWMLSPGGIRTSSSMNQRRRDENCVWRWLSDSSSSSKAEMTAHHAWNATCGWKEEDEANRAASVSLDEVNDDNQSVVQSGPCRLESIMIAAWCREQYQSFYMP